MQPHCCDHSRPSCGGQNDLLAAAAWFPDSAASQYSSTPFSTICLFAIACQERCRLVQCMKCCITQQWIRGKKLWTQATVTNADIDLGQPGPAGLQQLLLALSRQPLVEAEQRWVIVDGGCNRSLDMLKAAAKARRVTLPNGGWEALPAQVTPLKSEL